MLLCIEVYQKTNAKEWAFSAVATLPYALRYKTNKTKLLLAPIIKILKTYCN